MLQTFIVAFSYFQQSSKNVQRKRCV